jgi:hypothetical protein
MISAGNFDRVEAWKENVIKENYQHFWQQDRYFSELEQTVTTVAISTRS